MMLNSRPGSPQASLTTEPAASVVIVRNFNKGLMRVRPTIEPVAPSVPVAPPVIVQIQIRPPKLAQLPKAVAPRNGLLLSMSLHTAMAAVVFSVPMFVPTRLMNVRDNALDFDTQVEYQPLFLPTLPRLAETGASAKPRIGSGQKPRSVPDALGAVVAVEPPVLSRPKRDYAGAQTIVSSFPDSMKGVQTIRRPDLVSPPKLAYPLRLPSMVMLPVPAIPAPMAPRQLQPVRPNPKEPRTVHAREPTLQLQPPTVEMPKLPVAPAEPAVPPKAVTASQASSPRFVVAVRPEIPAPKAAVVINAVNVPPGFPPVIPEAELSSRFVVGPSRDPAPVETASGAAGGKLAGAGASKAGENLPHTSVENGNGTKAEVGDGRAGPASIESA